MRISTTSTTSISVCTTWRLMHGKHIHTHAHNVVVRLQCQRWQMMRCKFQSILIMSVHVALAMKRFLTTSRSHSSTIHALHAEQATSFSTQSWSFFVRDCQVVLPLIFDICLHQWICSYPEISASENAWNNHRSNSWSCNIQVGKVKDDKWCGASFSQY